MLKLPVSSLRSACQKALEAPSSFHLADVELGMGLCPTISAANTNHPDIHIHSRGEKAVKGLNFSLRLSCFHLLRNDFCRYSCAQPGATLQSKNFTHTFASSIF